MSMQLRASNRKSALLSLLLASVVIVCSTNAFKLEYSRNLADRRTSVVEELRQPGTMNYRRRAVDYNCDSLYHFVKQDATISNKDSQVVYLRMVGDVYGERGKRDTMTVAESTGSTATTCYVDNTYNSWDQLVSETRVEGAPVPFRAAWRWHFVPIITISSSKNI